MTTATANDSNLIVPTSSAESAGHRSDPKPKKKSSSTPAKDEASPRAKKRKKQEEQIGVSTKASEVEASSCSSTPASRRAGAGAGVLTASSECRFPMARMRRLMDGSEGGSKGGNAVRPTHEAVFLANKASELFLELFTQDANVCARRDHKKSIAYKHLSFNVSTKKKYEFLSDFVPEKVKAEDALKIMTSLEQ